MLTPKTFSFKGRKTLETALAWGKKRHPDAPQEHHRAFGNSVVELVRNEITPLESGGPSCREYAVSRASAGDGYAKKVLTDYLGELTAIFPDGRMPKQGEWDFERACELAEPLCYGKLTSLHFRVYKEEPCFDEAPGDLAELKKRST